MARFAMEEINGPYTLQIFPTTLILGSQWRRDDLDGAGELFTQGCKSKEKGRIRPKS
jgi:hypothetical protein